MMMQQPAGMRRFHGWQLLTAAPHQQGSYNIVVNRCALGVYACVCLVVLVGFACMALLVYLNNFGPQDEFYTEHSWCIFDLDPTDDDCFDAELYLDSDLLTADNFFNGEACYDDKSGKAAAFCTRDTNATSVAEWCDVVADKILRPACPWSSGSYFSTVPAEYDSKARDYVYSDTYSFIYRTWYYPTLLVVWGAFSLFQVFSTPQRVLRAGAELHLRLVAGCTQKVRLADMVDVYVLDRYDWCGHNSFFKYVVGCRALVTFGNPTPGHGTVVLLPASCGVACVFSLSEADFADFLASLPADGVHAGPVRLAVPTARLAQVSPAPVRHPQDDLPVAKPDAA